MLRENVKLLECKVLFTAIVIFVIAGQLHSQEYKVRISTMGNSITYGALLTNSSTECYPAQLGDMLSEIYGDTCEVKNFSVSARTMMRNAELPLWNEPQFKDGLEYVPDICLILLGTNDSKPYRWNTWGDEFLTDYLAMIDTFKFRNPNTKFIVCYPPPIWEGHPYGTNFSDSHNDSIVVNYIIPAIDTVVEKTGAILIDFHTPFVDSLKYFPDKLHPDIDGSRIMAEILYDTIIKTDIIHKIETGLSFISSFEQVKSPVAIGQSVELKWSTIFADSVFLDDVPVDLTGSLNVIAEGNKIYTLTTKGSKNTSAYPLKLNTYVPEISNISITPSSTQYQNGEPVYLYSVYLDQYYNEMSENTSGVTWTVIEGDANLGEQTDTSIVFIPVVKGRVVVEAKKGDLSYKKTLYISSITSVNNPSEIIDLKVFPNPVNDILYIEIKNNQFKHVQIKVYNLLGEVLFDDNSYNNGQVNSKFELKTSGLQDGLYNFVVYVDDNVSYGQFVKKSTQ